MNDVSTLLIALGGIFLLGLATDILGRKTPLPRVTLLLLFGIVIGKDVLNLIPVSLTSRFELITDIALIMVGFLLGGRLTARSFQHHGKAVIVMSITEVIIACSTVTAGLFLTGLPLDLAILFGCIAAATAPAATVDVVIESQCESDFSNKLLSIVALDDAWGLILFSVGIAFISMLNGTGNSVDSITHAVHDIGGAIFLGLVVGLPAAYITGRIKSGQPMLTEALGLVFLCGGLAIWLEVSFLIASMVMGVVIANLAKHHEYPFHAIEGIEWPFMVVFFVVAGASLELSQLSQVGLIGLSYILLRTAGKTLGGFVGATFAGSDPLTRRWMGPALLPQAGAAMGMALVAAHQLPQHQQILLTIVIGATIIFEIIGPVFTRIALRKTTETE